MRNAELLDELLGLRALAGAGRPEQNDVHEDLLSALSRTRIKTELSLDYRKTNGAVARRQRPRKA
ncbi:hypothetical protein Pcatena_02210 [Parolsenella catena]|uniref:Uncharacterized protein n=1 Tax=Parolsenella catena TaxID=2003188 RepID=A0A3G9K6I0_9ACTN|nr:hypothetical protein Pcatena_02210 [Parolsenella catena]